MIAASTAYAVPGYILGIGIFAAVVFTAAFLFSPSNNRADMEDPEAEDRDEQP